MQFPEKASFPFYVEGLCWLSAKYPGGELCFLGPEQLDQGNLASGMKKSTVIIVPLMASFKNFL